MVFILGDALICLIARITGGAKSPDRGIKEAEADVSRFALATCRDWPRGSPE